MTLAILESLEDVLREQQEVAYQAQIAQLPAVERVFEFVGCEPRLVGG
jgi:hypothetical protein